MKISDVLGIAVLGGIAYVGYKIIKGDWTLPNILKGAMSGIGETGYNVVYDTNLRDAIQKGSPERKKTEKEITETLNIPPSEQTDAMQINRTVARETATDVIEGPMGTGFLGAMMPFANAITIGAGLGAIKAQQEYYNTLPEDKVEDARIKEYDTRAEWMYEHPVESIIGLPANIIHDVTKPEDAKPSLIGAVIGTMNKPPSIEQLQRAFPFIDVVKELNLYKDPVTGEYVPYGELSYETAGNMEIAGMQDKIKRKPIPKEYEDLAKTTSEYFSQYPQYRGLFNGNGKM
jgi:hypothetical protein